MHKQRTRAFCGGDQDGCPGCGAFPSFEKASYPVHSLAIQAAALRRNGDTVSIYDHPPTINE